MPSKTAKQHRAMGAAAGGKSKLGIPQEVGKEFVKADKKAGKFSGTKKKAGKKPSRKRK